MLIVAFEIGMKDNENNQNVDPRNRGTVTPLTGEYRHTNL